MQNGSSEILLQSGKYSKFECRNVLYISLYIYILVCIYYILVCKPKSNSVKKFNVCLWKKKKKNRNNLPFIFIMR